MWKDFLTAISLVLIIEGLLPFLTPIKWQETIQAIAKQPAKAIRTMGFVSMAIGLIALYFIRHYV